MKRPTLVLLLAAGALSPFARAANPLEIPVWPGDAPGSEGVGEAETVQERGGAGVQDRAIRQIHRPAIDVFLPGPFRATGSAVLIVPGGGFEHLAIDKEGWAVAQWLAGQGFAGIVVKYRLPKTPGYSYTVETAAGDVLQAESVVRAHAAEWGIDPKRVGLLGFSVGGDLAALAATRPPADQKPAFVGLIYPHPLPDNFGGAVDAPPPAFIAQAADDTHSKDNGVRLFGWLKSNKGSAELHIFTAGGEGYGLGKPGTAVAQWPELFRTWLWANGFGVPNTPREKPSAGSLLRALWSTDRVAPPGSQHGRGYVDPQAGGGH